MDKRLHSLYPFLVAEGPNRPALLADDRGSAGIIGTVEAEEILS